MSFVQQNVNTLEAKVYTASATRGREENKARGSDILQIITGTIFTFLKRETALNNQFERPHYGLRLL